MYHIYATDHMRPDMYYFSGSHGTTQSASPQAYVNTPLAQQYQHQHQGQQQYQLVNTHPMMVPRGPVQQARQSHQVGQMHPTHPMQPNIHQMNQMNSRISRPIPPAQTFPSRRPMQPVTTRCEPAQTSQYNSQRLQTATTPKPHETLDRQQRHDRQQANTASAYHFYSGQNEYPQKSSMQIPTQQQIQSMEMHGVASNGQIGTRPHLGFSPSPSPYAFQQQQEYGNVNVRKENENFKIPPNVIPLSQLGQESQLCQTSQTQLKLQTESSKRSTLTQDTTYTCCTTFTTSTSQTTDDDNDEKEDINININMNNNNNMNNGNISDSDVGCENENINGGIESLKNGRYTLLSKIANTLQGDLCKYRDNLLNEIVVIKRTEIELHTKQIGREKQKVDDNIIKEQKILKWISETNTNTNTSNTSSSTAPKGFVRFVDFFSDSLNYYLVEEYGGNDLFDYVENSIKCVKQGSLSIDEWHKRAQFIICEIGRALHYFHYSKNMCHLDMSLENTLINENTCMPRIIDCGLSEVFPSKYNITSNNGIKYQRNVGKKQYKAPEVWYGLSYNPCKADVWSFGIMIFLILCGKSPFGTPDHRYKGFTQIWNGELAQLLVKFGLNDFIPPLAVDLLKQMLKPENERINMEQVLNHPYMKNAPTKL